MPKNLDAPYVKAAQRTAERQRLANQALAALPQPTAGMTRIVWFGNANTPCPVDIPEPVAAQIAGIWEQAEANKGRYYTSRTHAD